eukprot:TRINITY_DN635_c0_g2_i3.p1 TRINITY_DN635_c0_g2~~TRINITY_DN635_c0_g2_i3.p1  ORF type:complete len:518 (-),score=152.20 TRINITY_DN635_c0_g2_i3:191-1744(-)
MLPPLAVGERAAADLPASMAEVKAIRRVLHFFPLPANVSGLRCLRTTIKALEQRLEAIDGALDEGHRRKRLCAPATPAAAVLNDSDLLARIMRYTRCGHWIYIAPVSRVVGAAYMSHVVSTRGIYDLFFTDPAAALCTRATLRMALPDQAFHEEFLHGPQGRLSRVAGLSGSIAVVQKLCAHGMDVSPKVLIGAASHCDLRLLDALYNDVLRRRRVAGKHWCAVALALAGSGDAGFALTWLSQQRDRDAGPWPRYLLSAMCFCAAFDGRLATLQFLLDPRRGVALFGPLLHAPSEDESESSESHSDSEPGGDALGHLLEMARWTDSALWRPSQRHTLTLLDKAAGSGSTAVLEWLVGQGYSFTAVTMPYAAFRGRLAALQWLQQRGCPHDMHEVCAAALESAAATPRLMQWIKACGGGDWSPKGLTEMLRTAMLRHRDPAVAEWLRGQGAAWPGSLLSLFWCKERVRPRADMMVWAAAKGCSWGLWGSYECDRVADCSPTGRTRLHELGCPCDCPRE